MDIPVTYKILNAVETHWSHIVSLVRKMNLDSHDMHSGQFKLYEKDHKILGIGRIKVHADCLELCSLGVEDLHRGTGIGKALVHSLLDSVPEPVYVVTEIPAYFQKMGFRTVNSTIQSMLEKKEICVTQLSCKDPVIMVREM